MLLGSASTTAQAHHIYKIPIIIIIIISVLVCRGMRLSPVATVRLERNFKWS